MSSRFCALSKSSEKIIFRKRTSCLYSKSGMIRKKGKRKEEETSKEVGTGSYGNVVASSVCF